jgi:hypothetical protein
MAIIEIMTQEDNPRRILLMAPVIIQGVNLLIKKENPISTCTSIIKPVKEINEIKRCVFFDTKKIVMMKHIIIINLRIKPKDGSKPSNI